MTTTDETRFLYHVEGEPYLGTAADIAHSLEQAHYAGLDVGPTAWTFDDDHQPVGHPITATATPYNEDDYATVTIRVGGATASYRLDGRA